MQKQTNNTTPGNPVHLPNVEQYHGKPLSHSKKAKAPQSSPHVSDPPNHEGSDRSRSWMPNEHETRSENFESDIDFPAPNLAKTERPYVLALDVTSLGENALADIRLMAQERSALPQQVEEVVSAVFQCEYLHGSMTKRSVWKQVQARCEVLGLKPPSYKTVASRLDSMFSQEVLRIHFPN
ncbi:hypothetical protein ACYZT7_16910 [Pseudomonas sp. RT4P38]